MLPAHTPGVNNSSPPQAFTTWRLSKTRELQEIQQGTKKKKKEKFSLPCGLCMSMECRKYPLGGKLTRE